MVNAIHYKRRLLLFWAATCEVHGLSGAIPVHQVQHRLLWRNVGNAMSRMKLALACAQSQSRISEAYLPR